MVDPSDAATAANFKASEVDNRPPYYSSNILYGISKDWKTNMATIRQACTESTMTFVFAM